jgi:hypothetical protein
MGDVDKGFLMKTSFLLLLFIALLLALVPCDSTAQSSTAWTDALVDHMVGNWKMEGPIKGGRAHHEIQAEWVLNHQFLRIYEKTTANAPGDESRYEATWFLGYDPISERYVMHLLDMYGGRFSETLGYGVRDGNAIRFVYEYPDGPFHTTCRWFPDKGEWQWLMERKDKEGKWVNFGDLKLTQQSR